MRNPLRGLFVILWILDTTIRVASWMFDFSQKRPREEDIMSTHDHLDSTVLISVPNPAEAAAIVQTLTDAGIQATADGNGVVGFQVEAPAMIRILVHEDDFAKAREVLEESREHAEAINWDEVDVGVPEEE